MPRLVAVEGPLFNQLATAMPTAACHGLSRQAFLTFDAAQAQTAWALRNRRWFALMDGERVLAGAARYDLTGTLADRPVRICALGAVFGGRGHDDTEGHAAALVERLLRQAARDGADLALAFRAPGAAILRTRGFESVPLVDSEISVAESPRHGAPMTTVRGGADRDIAAIVQMGRARARQFKFHVDRDVEFVKYALTRTRLLAGLGPAGARQLEFVIAEEGITAAAYAVISVAGGTWTIEECGDRDPSGARVGALLQALIAREPSESRPIIRGWLPPGFLPPQLTIASTRPVHGAVLVRGLSRRVSRLNLASADALYWHADVF
jgi:hypothetical protein